MFSLSDWLQENKVSRRDLAARANLSEHTIYRVLDGCSVYESTLKAVCQAIGREYNKAEWSESYLDGPKYKEGTGYLKKKDMQKIADALNYEEIRTKLHPGMRIEIEYIPSNFQIYGCKSMRVEGEVLKVYKTHALIRLSIPCSNGKRLKLCKDYTFYDIAKYLA